MRPTLSVFMSVLMSLLVAAPLLAQRRTSPQVPCLPCDPGSMGQPGQPAQPGTNMDPNNPNANQPNPNQPNPNQPNADTDTSESGGRGAALASGSAALPGFVGGFGQRPGLIVAGGGGLTTNLLFSGFKVLGGDSLVPIDRIYTSFSYTNGIVQDFTSQAGSRSRFDEFQELFGVEKTLWNDRASVTFRVPVSTIYALPGSIFQNMNGNGGPGTSTVVGDGSIVLKTILHENKERGNLFAGGLEFSFPLSSNYFFQGNRGIEQDTLDWIFQPYLGCILRRGEFSFQSTSGFGFPTSAAHASYFYTSNSVSWMFYQSPDPKRFVTSMSGVAELYVLEPIGGFRGPLTNLQGTADLISVTMGNSIAFRDRLYLTYGIATPVTRQRPYSTQLVTNVSVRY